MILECLCLEVIEELQTKFLLQTIAIETEEALQTIPLGGCEEGGGGGEGGGSEVRWGEGERRGGGMGGGGEEVVRK